MDKQNEKLLIVALLGGLVAFILWKMGKKAGDTSDKAGGIVSDCEGALESADCKAIGLKLRLILDEWYVDANDEVTVVGLFKRIPDECSYRKVYESFGSLTHFYPNGTGDLDYWMGKRISEDNLAQCRIPGTTF